MTAPFGTPPLPIPPGSAKPAGVRTAYSTVLLDKALERQSLFILAVGIGNADKDALRVVHYHHNAVVCAAADLLHAYAVALCDDLGSRGIICVAAVGTVIRAAVGGCFVVVFIPAYRDKIGILLGILHSVDRRSLFGKYCIHLIAREAHIGKKASGARLLDTHYKQTLSRFGRAVRKYEHNTVKRYNNEQQCYRKHDEHARYHRRRTQAALLFGCLPRHESVLRHICRSYRN